MSHMPSPHLKTLFEHAQSLLRRDARWRRGLQVWLVLTGAGFATIAQLAIVGLPDTYHAVIAAVGICAAVLALLGGIVLAGVDEGTAAILADALASEERAATAEAATEAVNTRIAFAAALYAIARTGMEFVERYLATEPHDRKPFDDVAFQLSDLVVDQKYDLLRIGDEEWSLTIFLHDPSTNQLVPRVPRRRTPRAEQAPHRRWPADVGHGGRAFSTKTVLVCPDAQDPGEAQYFQAPAHLQKPGDNDIFRSFASVPILLGSGKAVGVVTATSNVPGRFVRVERDSAAIDRIEALRLLASLVALLYVSVDDAGRHSEAGDPK